MMIMMVVYNDDCSYNVVYNEIDEDLWLYMIKCHYQCSLSLSTDMYDCI